MSSEEISCNCAQLFGFSAAEDGVRPEQEPLKGLKTFQTQKFIRQTSENEQKLRQCRIHPSIFCHRSSCSEGRGGVAACPSCLVAKVGWVKTAHGSFGDLQSLGRDRNQMFLPAGLFMTNPKTAGLHLLSSIQCVSEPTKPSLTCSLTPGKILQSSRVHVQLCRSIMVCLSIIYLATAPPFHLQPVL